MNAYSKLYSRITEFRRASNLNRPLLAFTIILLATSVLMAIQVFGVQTSFTWPTLLFFVSYAFAGALYYRYYKQRRLTDQSASQALDKRFDGKNRLETMVELTGTNHPLKKAQISDTSKHFKSSEKRATHFYSTDLLFIALLFLFFMQFSILGSSAYINFVQQTEPKGILDLPPALADIEESAIEAIDEDLLEEIETLSTLSIHYPSSEIEASKLDEIIWTGMAETPRPLKNLSLSIMVNGEEMPDIPVEDIVDNDTGEWELEGAFYLDEYTLSPFDVITYYLKAEDTINGNLLSVVSEPHFIRIRPEDRDLLDPGSDTALEQPETNEDVSAGPPQETIVNAINEVYRLIDEELVIIKATVASQNTYFHDKQTSIGHLNTVYDAQKTTAESMDTLFTEVEALPPQVYEGLKLSREELDVTLSGLSVLKNDSADSAKTTFKNTIRSENIALSHMVATLKNLQFILQKACAACESGSEQREDPFKNMQKYVIDEEDVEENLASRMDGMVEMQSDINEETEESENSGEPSTSDSQDKQSALDEKLDELLSSYQMSPEVLRELRSAQKEMKEALASMEENDPKDAGEAGEKALENLLAARDGLKKDAKEQMADAISSAKDKVAQAKNQAESGDQPKGSGGSSKELAESALEDLDNAFEWQTELGELQNAQKIANLLKSIHLELGESGLDALDPEKVSNDALIDTYGNVLSKIIQHEVFDQSLNEQLAKVEEALREVNELQESKHLPDIEVEELLGIREETLRAQLNELLDDMDTEDFSPETLAAIARLNNASRYHGMRLHADQRDSRTAQTQLIVDELVTFIRKETVTQVYSSHPGNEPFAQDASNYFKIINEE